MRCGEQTVYYKNYSYEKNQIVFAIGACRLHGIAFNGTEEWGKREVDSVRL
jgi:hypothetical protein